MTENKQVSPYESVKQVLATEKIMQSFHSALSNTNISYDKFRSALLNSIRVNDKLLQCDPHALAMEAINIAQAGLMVDPVFNHAYILPYGGKPKAIIGYAGIIYLAQKAGFDLSAQLVYTNDVFEIEYGFTPMLKHIPNTDDRGDVKGAYCIFRNHNTGFKDFIYMTIKEVYAIRDRSRFQNPLWKSDLEDMVRKTVIRKAKKYLPLGIQSALSLENEDFEKNDLQKAEEPINVSNNQLDNLEEKIVQE